MNILMNSDAFGGLCRVIILSVLQDKSNIRDRLLFMTGVGVEGKMAG